MGGFSLGVPPLPIPNREVKPERADGTAPQCGRVGRRLLRKPSAEMLEAFSLCLHKEKLKVINYKLKVGLAHGKLACVQWSKAGLFFMKGKSQGRLLRHGDGRAKGE